MNRRFTSYINLIVGGLCPSANDKVIINLNSPFTHCGMIVAGMENPLNLPEWMGIMSARW